MNTPAAKEGYREASIDVAGVASDKGSLFGHRILRRLSERNALKLRETKLFQDVDGNCWITSWNTVYRYDLRQDRLEEFRLTHEVDQIAQSGDKKLWACGSRRTLAPGLSVFDGKQWVRTDIQFSPIDAIVESSDGKLLFVGNDKLMVYENAKWAAPVKIAPGYATFEAGLKDSQGNIWLAAVPIGIYSDRERQWKEYTTAGKLGFDSQVSCLYEDRLGRIWFGCVKGEVAVYDKKADLWQVYKLKDHVPASAIGEGYVGLESIFQDKTGKLLFGTWKGLLTFDERECKWDLYTKKNSALKGEHVSSIVEDKSGRIWIGTNLEIVVLE